MRKETERQVNIILDWILDLKPPVKEKALEPLQYHAKRIKDKIGE